MSLERTDYPAYLERLEAASGQRIHDFSSLLDALRVRMDFFASMGCVTADHGLPYVPYAEASRKEVETIFSWRLEMCIRDRYGTGFDTVTLKEIRQIPGVTGVITTLYDTKPGEVWSRERIRALKQEVEGAGLHISGIESVNVHDAIKTGAADRDVYVGRYIETLENLGQEDIHLVCYNFMPVFDWTRTELARLRPDG